ncbi:hypothetical protein BTJ39_02485 [Izhakiella australiensis]|uniref:ABC transmembrane type-1 domain-containing protein n=1 Tax=Izhakiella australiensis TaxID=1926881 RepID=A0A1S8YS81_9GAMM|nr:ABC transporter permease [Izhakiella australiensis]OON42041.1 hypothetical protein BTJ39_02485 [Izhakiella australiensis]
MIQHQSGRGGRLLLGSFSLLVLTFLMLPIIIIVAVSFSPGEIIAFPPGGLSLRWYHNYFSSPTWMTATRVSVVVAFLTAISSVILGSMASVALVRNKFPGKNLIRALMMGPLIVPKIITAVGLYFLYMHFRMLGTMLGLVIAHTLIAVPYVIMIMTSALYGFDRRLEWAARSLGAAPLKVIWHVHWPVLRPAIISATLFSFIASFDDIILSLFLSQLTEPTLPRQIWVNVQQFIDPTIAAVSTLMTLVSVLGLWMVSLAKGWAQKQQNLTNGEGK